MPENSAPRPRAHELSVPRIPQPDDVTCGPSCLLSVLSYFGYEGSFAQLKAQVPTNPDGGTLAVYLAIAAHRLGYGTKLYSYDLRVLDPTWSALSPAVIAAKLRARADGTPKLKLQAACRAYATYLEEGGSLDFSDLSADLLAGIIDRDRPIICGLNSTYLYGDPRARPDDNVDDDVHGDPVGHFLVVSGHDGGRHFTVTDPSNDAPHLGASDTYPVSARRLINAILLGIVSFDAVLLEIWPERS